MGQPICWFPLEVSDSIVDALGALAIGVHEVSDHDTGAGQGSRSVQQVCEHTACNLAGITVSYRYGTCVLQIGGQFVEHNQHRPVTEKVFPICGRWCARTVAVELNEALWLIKSFCDEAPQILVI